MDILKSEKGSVPPDELVSDIIEMARIASLGKVPQKAFKCWLPWTEDSALQSFVFLLHLNIHFINTFVWIYDNGMQIALIMLISIFNITDVLWVSVLKVH